MRWLFFLYLIPVCAKAQYSSPFVASSLGSWPSTAYQPLEIQPLGPLRELDSKGKLYQRNYGAQLGFQRGAYNFLEMGAEYHWRTISLTKPRMFSAGGSFGYNFWDNTAEYKASFWYKWGRVALTYGGNLVYATNFKQGRIGVAPAIGFRLLSFHLTTGHNFLWGGDEEFKEYNTFYVSLRYFFQIDNKFKWKKTKKKDKKDSKDFKWPWKKE